MLSHEFCSDRTIRCVWKIHVENGNVFAESSVELDSSEVNGTVTLNDVNNYTAINGSTATSVERGSVSKADVNNIDFNAIAAEVTAQSQEFASISVNGTTTLSCTDANDSGQAVTCIDASWFSAADKGIVYDFSTTSYNTINVYGESVELFNTGFFNTAFTQEKLLKPYLLINNDTLTYAN